MIYTRDILSKTHLDWRPVAERRSNFLPPLHLDVLGGELQEQLLQPPLFLGCPRLVERHRFLLVECTAADEVLEYDVLRMYS